MSAFDPWAGIQPALPTASSAVVGTREGATGEVDAWGLPIEVSTPHDHPNSLAPTAAPPIIATSDAAAPSFDPWGIPPPSDQPTGAPTAVPHDTQPTPSPPLADPYPMDGNSEANAPQPPPPAQATATAASAPPPPPPPPPPAAATAHNGYDPTDPDPHEPFFDYVFDEYAATPSRSSIAPPHTASGAADNNKGVAPVVDASQQQLPVKDDEPPPPQPTRVLFDLAVLEDYLAHRRGRYGDDNDDLGLWYDEEDLRLADEEGTYKVLVEVGGGGIGEDGAGRQTAGGTRVPATHRSGGGGTLSLAAVRRRQMREAAALPLGQPLYETSVEAGQQQQVASSQGISVGGSSSTIGRGRGSRNPLLSPSDVALSATSPTGANEDTRSPLLQMGTTAPSVRGGGGNRLGRGGGNSARLAQLRRDNNTTTNPAAATSVGSHRNVPQASLEYDGSSSAFDFGGAADNDARASGGASRFEWRGGRHGGGHALTVEGATSPTFSPREHDGPSPQEEEEERGGGNGPAGEEGQSPAAEEAKRRRQLYRTCDTHWFTFTGQPSDVLAFRSLIANDVFRHPPPLNRRTERRVGGVESGEVALGRRGERLDANEINGDQHDGLVGGRSKQYTTRPYYAYRNSPFPSDVLAMIFLFIPTTNRRQLVALSSVCQQWRYYCNYCPHWTRLRLNTFVGGFPRQVQEKLKQRKIVTRDELIEERRRAKAEAADLKTIKTIGRVGKEAIVFAIIIACLLFGWAFAVALPALATTTLNTDGKIGASIFFPMLVLSIIEYWVLHFIIDYKYFADPNAIAGVGQEDRRTVDIMRARNEEAREQHNRQAQRTLGAAALQQQQQQQSAGVGHRLGTGGRGRGAERSFTSAAIANPAAALSSRVTGGGGRGALNANGMGGRNMARVAPAPGTPLGPTDGQQQQQLRQGGGTTVVNMAQQPPSNNTVSQTQGSVTTTPPAPPPPPPQTLRARVAALAINPLSISKPKLTAKSRYMQPSKVIRTVPWLLIAFNVTAAIVIGLLWGRIRSVDGLIEMGEGPLWDWGLLSSTGSSSSATEVIETSPPPQKAYYTLPASLTNDPRWLLVNPLLFTSTASGGNGIHFITPPIVVYNYSSLSDQQQNQLLANDPSRWSVNRTDFLHMSCGLVGGPSCFALLWFDEAMQSAVFGGGANDADSYDYADDLIPSWWNETFPECAANQTVCDANVTTTNLAEGSGVGSVSEIVALLLRTVTAEQIGANPYVLGNRSSSAASGGGGECPINTAASSSSSPIDFSKGIFVAVADGLGYLRNVLAADVRDDPYAYLRRLRSFRQQHQAGSSASPESYASVVKANYYGNQYSSDQAAVWYETLGGDKNFWSTGDDGGGGLLYSVTGYTTTDGGITGRGEGIFPLYHTAMAGCTNFSSGSSSATSTPTIPLVRYDIPQSLTFAKDRRTRLVIAHALLPIIFIVLALIVFILAMLKPMDVYVEVIGTVVKYGVVALLLNPLWLIAFGGACIAQSVHHYPRWSNDPPPIGPYEAPLMCDTASGAGMLAVGVVILIVFMLTYVKRSCQEA